jgi:hypothetical protein
VAAAVLSAGKHLLLEKPMCLTIQQCDDLLQLARRNCPSLAAPASCSSWRSKSPPWWPPSETADPRPARARTASGPSPCVWRPRCP